MKNKFLSILFVACIITNFVSTRVSANDSTLVSPRPQLRKFYIGTGMDGGIFSTATIKSLVYPPVGSAGSVSTATTTGTLRFSWFINTGVTFNFNLSAHFGVFTGIDLKNIGYIEQSNGWTIKRRTYNVGVPLGIKIGNMRPKRTYMFLGGGLDMPVNYKEKYFQVRNEKTKTSEWFSQRTPAVMPYGFIGLGLRHGICIKAQYYFNNFLNPEYKDKNGHLPYYGEEVHLIMFSIGFAVPTGKHHDMVANSISDLKTK
jgi:hypothetical protein